MSPFLDALLKRLHLKPMSLAERVNRKVISGYQPSEMAKSITGSLTSDQINALMRRACQEHASKTGRKTLMD